MTTKVSRSTTKVGQPELAGLEEVIADLRGCVDELREQVQALTAELEQAHEREAGLVRAIDDAYQKGLTDGTFISVHRDDFRVLLEFAINPSQAADRLLKEIKRLRALETAAKSILLYSSGAVGEFIADSENHFARDAVIAALRLVRETLADD